MDLAEFAGAARGVADRAQAELAMSACREAARDFLAVLRVVTPKRSGALANSETVTGPAGGGAYAVAEVGPHIIYAEFRNDGGTITAKKRNARGQYMLGTPAVGFFGRQVTQQGAHYMEKAAAEGSGVVAQACQIAAAQFIRL